MGIGAFIRKFNDTECDCGDIEQLGISVPYFTGGRPVYEVYFAEHFLTEMRQALRYDRDIYNQRRFKMSQIEYEFWETFQPFNDQINPIQYVGELQIACESLDTWLHREVQNLVHDGPVRLDPDKCNGMGMSLYDSLDIPVDTTPAALPVLPPIASTSDVYLLNGSQAITYPFQAGGFTLANVADGVEDDDGATYKQVVASVSDSLELGTYE